MNNIESEENVNFIEEFISECFQNVSLDMDLFIPEDLNLQDMHLIVEGCNQYLVTDYSKNIVSIVLSEVSLAYAISINYLNHTFMTILT